MDDGLTADPENHARLSGLLAMVALPLVRDTEGRMVALEILVEYAPQSWMRVEGAAVELGKLIVWSGSNGSRLQREFSAKACPPWRTVRPPPKYLVPDDVITQRTYT